MKEKIKIGEWVSKHDNFCHENEFITEFKNTVELNNFYNYCRSVAIKTNFGGDEYNKNSFIIIELDDNNFIINPPTDINGDTNWDSYHDGRKKMCSITKY